MSAKVLDRVRKLLAKVAPTANTTEEEARTAAVMACRAILEHGLVLSLAQPAAPPPPSPPPPYDPTFRTGRYTPWSEFEKQQRAANEYQRQQYGGQTVPPPHYEGTADFVQWVHEDLARKMREAAEKAARREARERERERWRQRDPEQQLDSIDDFVTVFGNTGTREWRQRRSAAWRAAGRPKREEFVAETGEVREVPDYSGLSF